MKNNRRRPRQNKKWYRTRYTRQERAMAQTPSVQESVSSIKSMYGRPIQKPHIVFICPNCGQKVTRVSQTGRVNMREPENYLCEYCSQNHENTK